MIDDPKKTDWSRVDHSAPDRNLPEVIPTGPEVLAPAPSQTVGGVLQRLKEGKIVRKAALHELEVIATARLDVLTHQLQEAAKVKKTEATVTADRFLKELDLQFQEVVQALGIRNEAIRRETLKKLSDETSRDLKEIVNKDWPDFMKNETIDAINHRWRQFLRNLMKDVSGDE